MTEAYLLQRSIRWQGDCLTGISKSLEAADGGWKDARDDYEKVALLEILFYLRHQLLRDADITSMANSVEL